MFGVFWDCDGTIMDTERLYAYAWQAHLEKYNFFISEEEIRQFVGVDDRIVHSFYAEQVNLENFETTMQELGKIIETSLNEKIIYEDAKILLNELTNKQVLQACVSASPYKLLVKKLKEVDIEDDFKYIIGGDMVSRNKPYPDIYNKAISELGTNKNLIIEDSPTGISSGKASDSFVLAIDRGMFSKDDLSQADMIVEELNLETVESIFQSL